MKIAEKNRLTAIGGEVPTNGGRAAIETAIPYVAEVTIEGTADILFHRWNCEAVAEKASAAKGSKAKKTDDLESYVYRDDDGNLALPGNYIRGALIGAAKFRQDPRSPRKSAQDLYKAGIVPLTALSSFGVKAWEYEHSCRVVIQRNAVTRVRPAMKAGWRLTYQIQVNLPEYISPADLNDALVMAGKLIGLADNRPTYGRFNVVKFEVLDN